MVGHVEDPGVQHRLRHGGNIGSGDLLGLGKGRHLVHLADEVIHHGAAVKEHIVRRLLVDAAAQGTEALLQPTDQCVPGLPLELHHLHIFIYGGGELFHFPVRLVGNCVIDKHHGAVVRQIL